MRELSTWLVAAFAGGVFVAGCGSSSISTTNEMPARNSAAAIRAMANCKQVVSRSTLSAEAKTRLNEICGLAPSSNRAPINECIELLHALHVPTGAAMEQAVCRSR